MPSTDMTDEEFEEAIRKKPPPDQEFLDWELDMLKRQVTAGQIPQAEMDRWIALRKKA